MNADPHRNEGPAGPFSAPAWDLGRVVLQAPRRPLVMGILNLTPDSFHAGSRTTDPALAVRRGLELAAEGADILDLGAESSRPGAESVPPQVERERLLPVVAGLRAETDIPLTVDTVRAGTAAAALDEGADAINDISAGRHDPAMLPLAADRCCGLVLMHMQGSPRTMQDDPRYGDVVAEVARHLDERVAATVAAGVAAARILVDPGIGFGKTLEHNLALLGRLREACGGRPFLLGASRKRFIGEISGADAADRLPGSLAAAAAAALAGATVVRVHDVAETVQFLDVFCGIRGADRLPPE